MFNRYLIYSIFSFTLFSNLYSSAVKEDSFIKLENRDHSFKNSYISENFPEEKSSFQTKMSELIDSILANCLLRSCAEGHKHSLEYLGKSNGPVHQGRRL